MRPLDLVLGLVWPVSVSSAFKTPLTPSLEPPYLGQEGVHGNDSPYYELNTKIERVAVIGAGPSGLLHASTLIENGFQVRLFDRAPNPGGNWYYSEKAPIPASFPYAHRYLPIMRLISLADAIHYNRNPPIEVAGYTPDIPETLPSTRIYSDGDDGVTNDWRVREQWSPSPIWAGMKTTLNPVRWDNNHLWFSL